MHPNRIFRDTPNSKNLDFARERGFGTLSINGENGPMLAHIPFVLGKGESWVDLHLVRSNPIVKLLKTPQNAILSILGPDSYISPDWYESPQQVPTWNYIAVHLRGRLSLLPQSELHDVLSSVSKQFETRLAPKPAWSSQKMEPEGLAKMMKFIVPLRLQINDIQSTWKLGQNKPDAARERAADQVAVSGLGYETRQLAALMKAPPAR